MAATQVSTTWRKILTFATTATKISNTKASGETTTDEPRPSIPRSLSRSFSRKASRSQPTQGVIQKGLIDNASNSPLLRLPAEIRNQIYLYLFPDYTIEVLMLTKSAYIPLDGDQKPLKHNPYPNAQLWFRLEDANDRKFDLANFSNGPPKRRRCKTVPGLFATSQVCSQMRAETLYTCFEQPAFVFTDERYNHTSAFPALVASLSIAQLRAIQTIKWPFSQARNYRYALVQRRDIEKPDVKFDNEFAELAGLKKVVLRYMATDVSHGRIASKDKAQQIQLEEDMDPYDYSVVMEFLRELGIKGMRKQLGDREDVEVVCERM